MNPKTIPALCATHRPPAGPCSRRLETVSPAETQVESVEFGVDLSYTLNNFSTLKRYPVACLEGSSQLLFAVEEMQLLERFLNCTP